MVTFVIHESMIQERVAVQIKIKPYLKAFLLSIYGKNEPLFFPKKDKFNDLLAHLLSKPPSNFIPKAPSPDGLLVIIPYFEHINIVCYNHLSQNSQVIFEQRVQARFWVTFESYIDESFRLNISISNAISLFVEKYNIPYTSVVEDMLKKAIYRSRRIQKKYPKRSYTYNK